MRKNPIGDFVLGMTGGALSSYFLCGAAVVLFTGHALGWGPSLPIASTADTGPLLSVTARLGQALYFIGLACLVFLGFRFLQEVLRGHTLTRAAKEAVEMPHLLP